MSDFSTHPPRRVGFYVEYEGTDFVGWQDQGPRFPTIQATIEKVLSSFFKTPIGVSGSSRTDSGVHARAQVAAIAFSHPIELAGLEKVLNSRLPDTIAVRDLHTVHNDFFPRRAVRQKTYRYEIYSSRWQRPLIDKFVARTTHTLNIESMITASEHLVGTHDFKSYAASDHQGHTTVRTLKRINVQAIDEDRIRFEVTGTGFLKQMVRNLVGSLIEVGRDHRSPDWIESVLHAQDRSAAGPTAHARGLTLWHSDVNWSHGEAAD
jgi:tRNA pseudouridine38-40 synthase